MRATHTFEVDGKTVEIHQDETPQNPRDTSWNENSDMMVCSHSRYNLGDKHDYKPSDYNSVDEFEAQLVKDHNPVVIKRLYLYDHSGITIRTTPFSCPWDSGQVGFVFMSRENALKCWGLSKFTNNRYLKTKVDKYIEATVKEYDQYLTGDVYGYIIKDEDGEEIDSCWGFFGYDYCIEQATEAAKVAVVPAKAEKENPDQLQLNLTPA